MKHSFSEYNTQKDVQRHQVELKEVTEKLAALPMVLDYSGDLEAYYDACEEYYSLRAEVHVSPALTHWRCLICVVKCCPFIGTYIHHNRTCIYIYIYYEQFIKKKYILLRFTALLCFTNQFSILYIKNYVIYVNYLICKWFTYMT